MYDVIVENLESRMPILMKTLNGINNTIFKRTNGVQRESLGYKTIKRSFGIQRDEDLIVYLNQFDPTKDAAKYTQWIVKKVGEGRLRLPEDGDRLLKTLSIFDKVKNSTRADINKDINSYNNFRDLEQLMAKYNDTTTNGNVTIRQWEKWIKTQGYTKVYADTRFTMLRFDKTGKEIEVFPKSNNAYESNWIPTQFATAGDNVSPATVDIAAVAVSKLACGTSYCVANPRTAQGYLEEGPLYAIFKDGQFILLADGYWSQFANTNDEMISIASGQVALFLSKVILNAKDQLTSQQKVASIILRTVNSGKVTNQKAIEIMKSAISLVANNQ